MIKRRHCEGEDRSNPENKQAWIASPQAARNDETNIIMRSKFFLCITVLFCFSVISLKAQNIITDLETSKTGEGTVHITCDPKIIELLGTPTSSPRPSESVSGNENGSKGIGYRIQIYMDNSPKAKNEVVRIQRLFNETFPNIETYVSYNAPNWRVLVGDFRTREEANAFKQSIQNSLPEFKKELSIVPSRIILQ